MTPTKNFRYAAFALKVLEKLLGSNFSVSGIEKIPQQPVMFVANHFTRSETFFVPYLIHKHTGRQVRCLADSGLYHGALGRFLESVGTISTHNKNRDNIILKDLITAQYDWMIYPEGSMLKSKEITEDHGFINYTPYRVGPVRTGSAILALKSQLFRDQMIEAEAEKNYTALRDLEKNFDITFTDELKKLSTKIVPVNITYYPLRPGKNPIQKMAQRFVKKIPTQISEELEIEGNLLLGAEINLSFGDPIDMSEYVKSVRGLIYQIPIIKNETKDNFILRYFKSRLTNDFMGQLYSDSQINLDHIFAASLNFYKDDEIEVNHLKRIIYLSATHLQKFSKHRLNKSIFEENLVKLFTDEEHKGFDGIFELAQRQGIIELISANKIRINKDHLRQSCDFHEIRLENSLRVILNEILLLEDVCIVIKRSATMSEDALRKKVFDEICARDLESFENDYQIYFDEKMSKDKSVGRPFFMDSDIKTQSRIRKTAVLLCHGYKSAPKEVEALARFLNGFGLKVYASRLKGHGTAPVNIRDTSWHEWYDSMQRGYAALHNISARIVVIGFSTGGLLGLVSAAKKNSNSKKLFSIIAINSALKLRDIRAKMVPGINIWNEMLEKLHIEKGRFEFVDDVPENPNINYSRNYLKGVEQLEKLMSVCDKELFKITVPSLVMQGKNDNVVNPESGKIIYDKINSEIKILSELDFSNHVIINSERKEEVFEEIRKFLEKTKVI